MMVVAIVGILAAIAYPSYRDQVTRTRRTDAQAVLLQAAQFMERIYTEYGCYNPTDAGDCAADADDFALPYTKSPIDGTLAWYDIGLADLTNDNFRLRATPRGPEADAGIMEIDEIGQRGRDRNDDDDTQDPGEDSW
jgi:type IV pilus assembly protein PilE